jgi:hypothetical protein
MCGYSSSATAAAAAAAAAVPKLQINCTSLCFAASAANVSQKLVGCVPAAQQFTASKRHS